MLYRILIYSMTYQHINTENTPYPLSPGKIICIGRNYSEHIAELNNPIPKNPLLFIKPSTALRSVSGGFSIPENRGECHYETELAVLIGEKLTQATPVEAENAIVGLGIALDLTLRDLQKQLKNDGHPWETSKAFDGSCPISPIINKSEFSDLKNIEIKLIINDEIRQQGNSSMMITSILDLLVYASGFFTFLPGDILLTGTPAGIGPLHSGDQLRLDLDNRYQFKTFVK